MLTNPQGYGLSLRRRLGPVFSLRMFPYRAALVCATDPVSSKAVLTDQDRFVGGDAASFLAPAVGAGSLICTPPPRHLRNRKLLLPPFHGKRIARWSERIETSVETELPELLGEGGGPVRPWAQRLTIEVILRVVFGVSDPVRLAVFTATLNEFVGMGNLTVLSLPKPLQRDLGRYSPGGRFVRLRAAVHALLLAEISARRADPGAEDVLSLLLEARDEHGVGLTDEEVRDELAGLVMAGYETTATTIAWVIHFLAHNPVARDALIDDLDAGSDTLLKATITEALRLRPAVYSSIRTAARDTELGGRPVPKDAFVASLFSVTHLDPELWPDPGSFHPQRHLDTTAQPYSLTPFGGGVRRCIGTAMAQLEIETVLRKVLRVAVPEPVGPLEGARLMSVTIVPAKGGRVRMRRRAPVRPRAHQGEL